MTKRFYELDLLRFAAAFAVLMFHYTFRGYAADNLIAIPFPSLAPVTKYGFLGVNLFFLISGFVILMTASGGSKRHFVVSRIVRLFPAFWICCTVTFGVSLFFANRMRHVTFREYLENLTMLGGFIGVRPVDSVYWSLFVEIRFYALVFLVLALRQIHRAKEILGVWLALYLLMLVHPIKYLSFLLIPEFAPYFIAGAMFFLISKEGLSLYKALVVGVCGALAIAQAMRTIQEMNAHYHTTFSGLVIGGVMVACFVAFLLVSTRLTERLGTPKWLVLGALTYPLYLIHQNIGFALFNTFYPRISAPVLLCGVMASMLAAAYLVTRAERACARPMRQRLLRLLGAPVRTASAPVARVDAMPQ